MCGSNERQPMVDEEELSADENDAKNDKHIESETRTSWSSPSPPPLTPSVTPNSSHPSASRRSSDDLSASLSTLSTRSEHSYVTPSKLTGMAVRPFPRTDWSSVTFADLNAPFWTPKEETEWAGREASRRWAMALESGDLNDLTIADFGVAVFDHVCELCVSSRAVLTAACKATGKRSPTKARTDGRSTQTSPLSSATKRPSGACARCSRAIPAWAGSLIAAACIRLFARPSTGSGWEARMEAVEVDPWTARSLFRSIVTGSRDTFLDTLSRSVVGDRAKWRRRSLGPSGGCQMTGLPLDTA
ncbi:hypothetical protein CC85DRAFT_161525 [Cutaneotrichosporon oleaginosum]|uniref:Uncharacterized protein n=1 Tax=Cutaneotrichosporon oleaginosum TaxID=879819 RepID=A0A0J0XGK6_9TREE|nr:uncharacterized protein CC85DRAFT_161525 [Cutaneotrichosporon oleaginosum]KLT40235.1 hypothetical protein CC85DRAFT_161525 [Cutaneotrichosporon oleaginosum]TXT10475.1 hypothetical protein COLE_04409 [Cutaneotrichosporon oleaginosum]